MVPFGESDHRRIYRNDVLRFRKIRAIDSKWQGKHTIIDIVETQVRIVGVIHNERSPETITILGGQMTVVPESTYRIDRVSAG